METFLAVCMTIFVIAILRFCAILGAIETQLATTPARLHAIDNNGGIKLHVPLSEKKWHLAVLCSTAVGPCGIL